MAYNPDTLSNVPNGANGVAVQCFIDTAGVGGVVPYPSSDWQCCPPNATSTVSVSVANGNYIAVNPA